METILETLIKSRSKKLFYYSPYNFLREASIQKQIKHFVIEPFARFDESAGNRIFEIEIEGKSHLFYVQFLKWDSDFFQTPTFKLVSALFDHQDFKILTKAVEKFKTEFQNYQNASSKYIFIDIPSEDIFLIRALTNQGFQQVETRLNYFKTDLEKIDYPRYNVRKATLEDIPMLEMVAKLMQNEYDRFHADSFFTEEMADNFLGKYVTESVKGFADAVLVPNEENLPTHGFLTTKYFKEDWDKLGIKASRMPLFAVAPTCKGWGQKLVSEMTYHLQEIGAECAFIGTQSANRAVCRIMENLNYRLGSTSHILSYYK